jgi:hypothetical protein
VLNMSCRSAHDGWVNREDEAECEAGQKIDLFGVMNGLVRCWGASRMVIVVRNFLAGWGGMWRSVFLGRMMCRCHDDDCIAYIHWRTVVKFNFRKAFQTKHQQNIRTSPVPKILHNCVEKIWHWGRSRFWVF